MKIGRLNPRWSSETHRPLFSVHYSASTQDMPIEYPQPQTAVINNTTVKLRSLLRLYMRGIQNQYTYARRRTKQFRCKTSRINTRYKALKFAKRDKQLCYDRAASYRIHDTRQKIVMKCGAHQTSMLTSTCCECVFTCDWKESYEPFLHASSYIFANAWYFIIQLSTTKIHEDLLQLEHMPSLLSGC